MSRSIATRAGGRRRSRGVTVLEAVAGLALVAVIGAGITFFVNAREAEHDETEAARAADRIRSAARTWRDTESTSDCPTISQLIHDHVLDRDVRTDDPWGERYRVECSEDDVQVRSAGRDGKSGTSDDVRIPGRS